MGHFLRAKELSQGRTQHHCIQALRGTSQLSIRQDVTHGTERGKLHQLLPDSSQGLLQQLQGLFSTIPFTLSGKKISDY